MAWALIFLAAGTLERRASEARLEVGLVSKLDVFRAQLQASQAEESLVRAEAGLDDALERFRVLLGLSPTDPTEPDAVTLPEAGSVAAEPVQALVARALANRLEIEETRDLAGDARRAASLARQSLLPQLDLNLGLTRAGFGTTLGESFRGADRGFTFFVTTSYPLARATAVAAKATAELEVAARDRALAQRRLEIESEVRGAAREMERIRKSIDLQGKAVEVAEQQLRLATLRYQRGLASNFDVVDAEGNVTLARTALVGLRTSYQEIQVEERDRALSVPIDAVFAKDGGHLCYVAERGRLRPREVELGPSNADHVVIERGLGAGERVALRDPSAPSSDFGSGAASQ